MGTSNCEGRPSNILITPLLIVHRVKLPQTPHNFDQRDMWLLNVICFIFISVNNDWAKCLFLNVHFKPINAMQIASAKENNLNVIHVLCCKKHFQKAHLHRNWVNIEQELVGTIFSKRELQRREILIINKKNVNKIRGKILRKKGSSVKIPHDIGHLMPVSVSWILIK